MAISHSSKTAASRAVSQAAQLNNESSAAVSLSGRIGTALGILVPCLVVDQLTKVAATRWLEPEPWSFLGDTFRLQYALNTGAFLGLAGGWSPQVRFWLLTVLNAGFLLMLIGILCRYWRMALGRFIACVLILAGGIGNLIDRISNDGQVTDFMNIGLGPVRSGIFNVADMAISGGALLLAWYWLHEERSDAARQATASAGTTSNEPSPPAV